MYPFFEESSIWGCCFIVGKLDVCNFTYQFIALKKSDYLGEIWAVIHMYIFLSIFSEMRTRLHVFILTAAIPKTAIFRIALARLYPNSNPTPEGCIPIPGPRGLGIMMGRIGKFGIMTFRIGVFGQHAFGIKT